MSRFNKLSLFAFALVLLSTSGLPMALSQPDTNIKMAESVLRDGIAAQGGRDALAQARKCYLRTTTDLIRDKNSFTLEQWNDIPLRRKQIIRFEKDGIKQTVIRVATIDSLWQRNNDGAVVEGNEQDRKERDDYFYRSYLHLLYPLLEEKDKYVVRYRGESSVNKKTLHWITVSSPHRKEMDLYFDKETHLLSKFAFTSIIAAEPGKRAASYYHEYESFGDVKFPRKGINTVDDKLFSEVRLLEMRVLKEFPENTFAKP